MKNVLATLFCILPLLTIAADDVTPKCEELINQLVEISEYTVGLHPSAWCDQFLGSNAEPKFRGGILGSPAPSTNPAMRALVQLGPSAIPSILKHLDDSRPTKLVVKEEGHIYWARTTNRYNNRPLGIDVTYPIKEESLTLPYVVKVGDVCLVILGQITNRPQDAVRYTPSGGVTICSPIISSEIVKAAREDWSAITSEALLQHFLMDAKAAQKTCVPSENTALHRIKVYFPAAYADAIASVYGAKATRQ
jgi:hypothetical protein